MSKLSAAVGPDGVLTVNGGPVRVRCFGWVDVEQDEALVLDGPVRQSSSERGHRFEGIAELDQLRVVRAERFGGWTALVLPRGSRLLVEGELRQPARAAHTAAQRRRAGSQPTERPVSPASREAARKVAGVVLALVLLDLFSR